MTSQPSFDRVITAPSPGPAAAAPSRDRAFPVYLHAFTRALIQTLGVAALGLAVFLLLIPVSTAFIPGKSIFDENYTHNQMQYRFYYESLTGVIHAAVIVFGAALAIVLFRFMLVKRSSDAYFAQGITRGKQLGLRFIIGIIMLAVVIFIPFMISLLMNISAFSSLGYAGLAINGGVYLYAGYLILGIVSFCVTALVCCMVGTMTEAVFFSLMTIGAPSILLYGANALMKHLLFGNSFGFSASTGTVEVGASLVDKLASYNPILFFYQAAKDYCAQYTRFDGFVQPPVRALPLLGWVIAALVIAALGAAALSRRKAEIAGVSGTSRILGVASTFLLPLLGFAIVLEYGADMGTGYSILAASLTFIVVFLIVELVQKNGSRGLSRGILKLPFGLGAVLVAVVILVTGGFGYSSRIPQVDRIASVQMSYAGSPNYLDGQVGGVSTGGSYYVMSNYTFTSKSDLEIITGLHKQIIDGGKGKLARDAENFSSTTVPYDIIVNYTLDNGSHLTRYYDRTKLSVLADFLSLDKTEAVRKQTRRTITGTTESRYWAAGAFRNGLVYLASSFYTNPRQVILSDSQRKELLGHIADDVEAQSLEDRYFPKDQALGTIMFTQDGGQESLKFGYRLENSIIYVTPSFTNTIQYLKETGLYSYLENTEEIESITLQSYDPYVGMNKSKDPKSAYFLGYIADNDREFIQTKDFGANPVVSDPVKMDELAPLLKNDYYMSGGGYLACVKLKNKNLYVYKFLPAKDAPGYLADAGEHQH
ncbi:ABC-2 type transport system permease protein [Paenibacillus forsythiae]|uniref:ABC-2 type transport system permease protein n=1 Tax=Paenibacillus forsythiae TaxID=365616 RepID=A0ABU3HB76_9BACL|nr:ABC transporter permease [Paenibacillus forsythiae]MDT3428081.1 ABC-2 type transport system permease protein [Paenibacillus forsythiae]